MSTITVKRSDGTPVNFNLRLENGLPLKAVFYPDYWEKEREEGKEYAIFAYIPHEEIKTTNNLNILNIYSGNEEIWVDCENSYIVFSNLNDTIMSALKEKKLVVYFFDEKENIIKSHSFI